MDSPPPNYNPNDSLLNGGTDASIMKVMGGGGFIGGDSAPNGYNETQSLLNGGLDAVIEKIQGGADTAAAPEPPPEPTPEPTQSESQTATTLSNREFVDYKRVENKERDEKEFDALEKIIQSTTGLTSIIVRIQNTITQKLKAIFRYVKINDMLERISPKDTNQIIQYVPSSAKYVVVVPKLQSPYDFFILTKFLIQGDLCTIDKTNNYKLKKDVYVIFLDLVFKNNINEKSVNLGEILEYMYYKFKSTNIQQCILITDQEKAILFLEDKTIGFLSNNTDSFFEPIPSDPETLNITEKDLIQEYGIKALKYTKSDIIYEDIQKIKSGDQDIEQATDYTSTLKDKVLLIKLKEFDIVYANIDLYGKKYKVRIPRFRDQSDSIFKAWTQGNYIDNERQLIEYLELDKLIDKNEIPKFLYYLS